MSEQPKHLAFCLAARGGRCDCGYVAQPLPAVSPEEHRRVERVYPEDYAILRGEKDVLRRKVEDLTAALAQRDAEAAAMRRALTDAVVGEGWDDADQMAWLCECGELAATPEQIVHAADCALSSSAGSALLEEMEGLRRANVAMASKLAPDWSRWIGPCVHGRDPWDRCDTCEEAGEAQSIVWVLDAERKKHAAESADLRKERDEAKSRLKRWEQEQAALTPKIDAVGDLVQRLCAESADLRARLERAEGRKDRWRMIAYRRRFQAQYREEMIDAIFSGEFDCPGCGCLTNNGTCRDCMVGDTPSAKTAAEVRQAVDAETERIAAVLRARARDWGADTAVGHALEVAAADIRSRGEA